jgi:hypothetical protein
VVITSIAKGLEHDIRKGEMSNVVSAYADLESSFANFKAHYRNIILPN